MRISSAGRQNAHSPSAGSSHQQSSRSSASASFSGARSQHPNVPGLRVDALLAHSAPPAPAVTSFERERRHAPAAKGARCSEASGRRRAAAGRPGSADGRVGGNLGGPAQAYAYPTRRGTKPGAHRTPQLRHRSRWHQPRHAVKSGTASLSCGTRRDTPALRRPEHRPDSATARKSCSRWKPRAAVRTAQHSSTSAPTVWTGTRPLDAAAGRHQSRLRDTRASMGGARLPQKDGSRSEWNRP